VVSATTNTAGQLTDLDGGGCAQCGLDAVLRLVTGLCEKAGVPCGDARPSEGVSSENEIILIPGAGLVARVTDVRFTARMRQELLVAGFLESAGIPVVVPAPAPPSAQLTVAGDRVITWWRFAPGQRASLPQVAARSARLHGLALPVPRYLRVARLDPTAAMRRHAKVSSMLPAADRDAYARHVQSLAQRWSASPLSRETGVMLHGDPHQDNAIAAEDGRVLLLDFEDVAIGPALYDLRAPIARVRMGELPERELDEFLTAYGRPVPEDGVDLVADVKIAGMCGAYVALSAKYPHIIEQTRLRIASLTDPSLYAGWWTRWHAPQPNPAGHTMPPGPCAPPRGGGAREPDATPLDPAGAAGKRGSA
jgi:hypothetical protein